MPLFVMHPTTENYEITHERKLWTHKILTRKNRLTTDPREKNLDTRKTHVKKFGTHKITTRKYFGPTKYPRENILDPQRHDGTRPTMACDPGNLAHSN